MAKPRRQSSPHRFQTLRTRLVYAVFCASVLSIGYRTFFFIVCLSTALVLMSPLLCGKSYKNFIRFAAAVFGLLVAGELAYRLLYLGPRGLSFSTCIPGWTLGRFSKADFDRRTYTGYAPGAQFFIQCAEVSLNQEGFRDRDHIRRKPEGTYRIALIGSSLALGAGVSEDARFSSVMERELGSPAALARLGRDGVEVINLSQSDVTPRYALDLLKNVAMAYTPDLLLFEINERIIRGIDPVELGSMRDDQLKIAPLNKNALRRMIYLINATPFLAKWADGVRGSIAQSLGFGPCAEFRRRGPGGSRKVQEVFEGARKYAGKTRVMGLVYPEYLSCISQPQEVADYVAELKELSRPYGIQILAPSIGARISGKPKYIFPQDPHLSSFAHEAYGIALSEQLLESL